MMQTKIEAADRLPTLHDAAQLLEDFAGEIADVRDLVFALSNPSPDWQFDPAALRGVWLAVQHVQTRALAQSERVFEAARLARSYPQ